MLCHSMSVPPSVPEIPSFISSRALYLKCQIKTVFSQPPRGATGVALSEAERTDRQTRAWVMQKNNHD